MIDPSNALDRTVRVIQDYVDAPDEAVVEALTRLKVRISADAPTLACGAGATALVAAFTAIARLGARIDLRVPQQARIEPVPPLDHEQLADALRAHAAKLIMPVQELDTVDLAFALAEDVGPTEFGLAGDDYSTRLTIGRPGGGWTGDIPFGGALAGVVAGAEVARAAVARLIAAGHPTRDPLALEARELTFGLPPLPGDITGLNLGTVDFVSAGAITHAVLFLLFRVPGLTLAGRIFDNDEAAAHNLNRYFLLDELDLGASKAAHLEGLSTHAIRLIGIERRVGGPESLAGIDPLAEHVCVGVDSVEARWQIQRLAPGWLGVGATTHAVAMASEHWPGTPCVGCLHSDIEPLQQRLPTISFVSLASGALLAYRLLSSAVAPTRRAESTIALNVLNLAADQPVVTEPIPPTSRCPVRCAAAEVLRV